MATTARKLQAPVATHSICRHCLPIFGWSAALDYLRELDYSLWGSTLAEPHLARDMRPHCRCQLDVSRFWWQLQP